MTSRSELDAVTGEIVVAEPRTLFHTDDPAEVLSAARDVADALKDALKSGGMVQRIGANEHVKLDGWQTVGAMLGISPYVVWSRPLETGWEARAEARTAEGRTVGAGEAMCLRAERNWQTSDEYAIRSMAQTRAMSKALSAPLRFIVTLAGHSGTPAEEVTAEAYGPEATPADERGLWRALQALYNGQTPPGALLDRLAQDAGGYLPRLVARAIMLAAAHRPGLENTKPRAEAHTDGEPDQPSPDLGAAAGS